MDINSTYNLFETVIVNYHKLDKIDQTYANPHATGSLDNLLYQKVWIDTVQWHCEDEVRSPEIDAESVRFFKNKIDKLNQNRTDLVEQLDDYFIDKYKGVQVKESARLNTESPAWAIDRLSILALKIYHMEKEVDRRDIKKDILSQYSSKLNLLKTQRSDLIAAIQALFEEIESGETIYKVYRQVKMYNDKDLNPVLRAIK